MSYIEGDVGGTGSGSDRLAIAGEQKELDGRDIVHQPICLELVLRLVQGRQVGRVEERLGLFLEGEQERVGDDRLHGRERECQLCRCVDACARCFTAAGSDSAWISTSRKYALEGFLLGIVCGIVPEDIYDINI